MPETGVHVPYLMARMLRAGRNVEDLALRKPAEFYVERNDLAVATFDSLREKYELLPVYPDKLLIRDGELQISRGNLALYLDDDHLSRPGSEPLVREILAQFRP